VEGITPPSLISAQATSLAWHPSRKVLAVGWENGTLKLWLEEQFEFSDVHAPHQAPIALLQWSSQGNRLVSADSVSTI
jgi:intraflagellar transport protein 140